MTDTITYATADDPLHARWVEVSVGAGGEVLVHDVVEANAVEGWRMQVVRDQAGHFVLEDGRPKRRRIDGPITLRLAADTPRLEREMILAGERSA